MRGDQEQIWEMLANISIGRVAAWIVVIGSIIVAICVATIKLYKVFEKYKGLKDKAAKQEKIIENHETTLKEIDASLQDIKSAFAEIRDVNLKQLRHVIVQTCETALERGWISCNELESLEEMYAEYVDVFHGNGYVKTLVMRVRKLKIVGKIEE